MDESFYEKLARRGLLGTKAKVSAEAGRADWSTPKTEDSGAKARKRLVNTAMRPQNKGYGG